VMVPDDLKKAFAHGAGSCESLDGSGLPAGVHAASLNSSIRRASSFDQDALEGQGFGSKRAKWVEAAWMFFIDPEYHIAAKIYHQSMNPLIAASVLFIMAQFIELPELSGIPVAVVEVIFDSIFCIDILMRFAFCPDHLAFLKNMFNWIDLWAVPALAFRAGVGFVLPTREEDETLFLYTQILFLGANPVLRLLKLLRRFDKCSLVYRALEDACEESIPNALWFVIVTMTTVGYGDITPTTAGGRVATSVLILVAMMYMAIPIGIIGNSFNRIWEDRNRFLIAQRTQHRLLQWGYEPADMPRLFKLFDPHCNGELNYKEFKRMMLQMNVGIKEKEVAEIFETFDRDGSGAVDDREFVREIFPQSYHKVYEEEDDEVVEDGAQSIRDSLILTRSRELTEIAGVTRNSQDSGLDSSGEGTQISIRKADISGDTDGRLEDSIEDVSEGHATGELAAQCSLSSRLAQRPSLVERC